jgi:hypothetical protein
LLEDEPELPYNYLYHCNDCGFDVEIVGAQEFYRDAAGEPHDYHYPAADTYEWPIKRVSGLWNRIWCPACRTTRPHILVGLDEPAEHPVQAFLKAEADGLTGLEVGPCPICGTEMTHEVEGLPCPRCAAGKLQLLGEYEP